MSTHQIAKTEFTRRKTVWCPEGQVRVRLVRKDWLEKGREGLIGNENVSKMLQFAQQIRTNRPLNTPGLSHA